MAFNLKFHTDVKEQENTLREKSEKKLTKLGLRYSSITSATVNVTKEVAKKGTPHVFKANVVIYIRPKNIAANKKADNPYQALKEALDAVERQVRKMLDKKQRPWEKPGEKISASGEKT